MQTYQIEIDPSALVHDGVQYEPVAFRGPRVGEKFVGNDGTLCASDGDYKNPRLIVRPVWQWPEWLGGAAIAMDANEDVWWYVEQPVKTDHGNFSGGRECVDVATIAILLPSFTPPPLKPGEIVWNPKCKRNNESE